MTNTFIFEFQYLFWKEAEKKSILEFMLYDTQINNSIRY